jgi:branched-chain amino acid aminotransferase
MNGNLVPFKDAKVHVLTHALHYSTAVFEGLRCYSTEKGPAIFRLGEHVDRLFNSAKMYSMEMPYSKDEITEAIIQTVRKSGLHECYIRPIAYYGYGEMGLTPTKNKVDVSIACWEWNMGESAAGKFTGAKCKVSSWVRMDSRVQPVKAKAASNYANAALARLEAIDCGYDEAIMLNRDGKVTEGSAENIFLVRGGSILTPPSGSGILEGITRDSVIQIIEAGGGRVTEREIDREDLYTADEVFMVGTAAEVKSVALIDRVRIGDGQMGSQTRRLQKAYIDAATGRNEKFLTWLKYI